MRMFKLGLSLLSLLAVGSANLAYAIDLYVDTKTKQVYTDPGPDRELMGTFERVTPPSAEASKAPEASQTDAQLAALKAAVDKATTDLRALENDVKKPDQAKSMAEKGILPAGVTYGKKGFEFKTDDGQFALAIQNRMQFRFAFPFDSDPRTVAQLEHEQPSFMIRRARTKLAGHVGWPFLKYYMQYDWSQPILRDLSVTIDKYPWAQLRFGRGKVAHNVERVSSSGNQQFVNRSITNDVFTVDRQQGVELKGNLFPKSWYGFSYWAGVYTGEGVGQRTNDDDNLMFAGRFQWNPLGGEMPFSQSDVERSESPGLNLAFAAATNQSRCTAFETASDSCRALTDFTLGKAGQYRIDQAVQEVRFKWRGLSVQEEMHWKGITDQLAKIDSAQRRTNLMGGYVQAGYFFHGLASFVPEQLELAGRYAFVDAYRTVKKQTEISGVLNYFLNGHSNKLSLQVSQLAIEDEVKGVTASNQRYWVQWDVSF